MYAFRAAGMESVDTLIRLWGETFTQAYDTIHTPENIRAYCAQNYSTEDAIAVLSSDQFDCTLVYRENIPVGYYILKHQPCPTQLDGNSYELKQIYILSSEYGNGLGKMLFGHALDVTRQASCRWLWLCVSDSNHRAQKFYKKLKFKPIAPGPILEVGTDKLSSTIMILRIEVS